MKSPKRLRAGLTALLVTGGATLLVANLVGASPGPNFHMAAGETDSLDCAGPQLHVDPVSKTAVNVTCDPNPTTTTTVAPTTTTIATTTTTRPPTTTTTVATTTTTAPLGCVGVAMTAGQPDIDAHAAGTTYCLSGTHNWALTPKTGDSLIGPATLDGGSTTPIAIHGTANNVTMKNLTIQHYNGGDQVGAINNDGGTGWNYINLNIGFNAHAGIFFGAAGPTVTGGRLHDNGQEGINGGYGSNAVLDGVEIDHNGTDATISCGYEKGGYKWVANNVTVKNSNIHDNQCKGLWSDINSNGMTINNNKVQNNSDEGIFIEISSNAHVFGNTVTGNGLHNYNGNAGGCTWLWGAGIASSASDHMEVDHNTVTGNCNGVTGIQQARPDGNPGLLQFFNVHDNTIGAPGGANQGGVGNTGVVQDDGSNLTTRSITFTNNTFTGGHVFCGFTC